ncbi:MAG TPA: acyl-[acyl-carrier-protein] thioesterase [Candidatus Tetragenococcus pullicola]|nr:acyl-[acyl-carrier-protein] thioesterase [Candidatus Tetragenococcus pullicola]
MAKKYTASHEVAYYEGDVNATMTMTSLVAVAIKVSEEQCAQLGVGSDFVHQFGLTWIVTNYQVFIERLPEVGETIRITTEPIAYNKYFCYRNFLVENEEGQELVRMETVFTLMDIKKRRISSVPLEVIAPFESEKTTKIKRLPKIAPINERQGQNFRVRFFDIDSNGHVNNAVYFTWLLDVLGYDFLTNYVPKYINIRFEKEVEYGSEVASDYEILDSEEGVKTLHEIKVFGQTNCEAEILWEKKE